MFWSLIAVLQELHSKQITWGNTVEKARFQPDL